jgi:hypothetical protein
MQSETREQLLDYLAKMKRFNEWEEANPWSLPPEAAIQALSDLYDLSPVEAQSRNDDPTYQGARYLLSCLHRLS